MAKELDAKIKVRGTQKMIGEKPQTIELYTDGVFSEDNGTYYVRYREYGASDAERVDTCFTVSKNEIKLSRSGAVEGEIHLLERKKTESLYNMGPGILLLGVQAKKIETRMSKLGGHFEFVYDVELEHVPIGENSYRVSVELAQ